MKKMFSIFKGGSKRKLSTFSNLQKKLITVYSLLIAFIQIYFIVFAFPDALVLRTFHACSLVGFAILLYSPNKNPDKKVSFFDFIFFTLTLVTLFYLQFNVERLILRWKFYDPIFLLDVVFGVVFILIVFEAGRRIFSWPMVLVAIFFFGYAFFGHVIPGVLAHKMIILKEVIETQFLTSLGLFGNITGIAATYVFMFILFGSFLQHSGGEKLFTDIGLIVGGASRGGAAKTAVIASSLFSMMSGSPNANVATTGSFTIPMMKKLGYQPSFAAAVEAAASCGGTITPPVMGAVAFILAEFAGVSYLKVIAIAVLPALIYYITMFFAIDRESIRSNLKSVSSNINISHLFKIMIEGLPVIIPVIYLVVRIIQGFPVVYCVWGSIILIVLCSIVKAIITKNKDNISLGRYITAIENAVKNAATVSVACILAGTIIGNLYLTGGGIKFSSLLMSLAQGFTPLVIILAAILTVLLGMGIPISACYILSFSLAGPALIMLGLPSLSVHFFIAFFAAMATITPPVCISTYLACSIAEVDDPIKTGIKAVKFALAGFLLPFLFLFRSELLFLKGFPNAFLTMFFVIIGIFALDFVMFGNFIYYKCKLHETIMMILSAVMLFYPSYIFNVTGFLIFGIVILLQYIKKNKEGINFRYNV